MSRNKLSSFLKTHYVKKNEKYTHTRMKDEKQKITGGSYNIPYGKDFTRFL